MRFRFAAALALFAAIPAHPCAILTFVQDGAVFMGNNEDYFLPGVIWFVPGRNGRYGRVNVGFKTDFAQGSMNEAGLAFDAAALEKIPWEPDPEKETPPNLLERIMFECATVEEAVAYFNRYNCKHLADGQFMFADATGDAAVIAWLPGKGLDIQRIDGGSLITTNTRLGASGYRCPRWTKANQVLAQGTGIDVVRDALDAIHQEGQATTVYSTIYDLKRKTVRVYNLFDFNRFVEFDLGVELDKGRHSEEMASFFESQRSLEEALKMSPRLYDTRIALAPEALDKFTGRYQPVGANSIISIGLQGSDLTWNVDGGSHAILIPESDRVFRIAPDLGQVSFDLTIEGEVFGLTLHRAGDGYAPRLRD